MSLIGIDLGIHKISIAMLNGDELIHALTHTSEAEHRDAQLHELGTMAHDQAFVFDASWVWIEDTLIGNNRKYSMQLAETKGAVLAHLSPLRFRLGMDIRMVDVGTWKKQVCGNGHATKEQVRNYIVESHPGYAPLCEGDQDLYDAACIGLYGRQILARADQLHL